MKQQQAELDRQKQGREALANGGRSDLAYTEEPVGDAANTLGGDVSGAVGGVLRRKVAA